MLKLSFVLSKNFDRFIIAVIIINAITLGMETSTTIMQSHGSFLIFLDRLALGIFTFEILAKLVLTKASYFQDGWNVFDFIIVAISYIPSGGISILRSLRVLRIFLLISALPRLRIIVRSLIISLPSIASIALLLVLIFYVAAVIATRTFGADFPEWFGTLGKSLFTLFQLMTLESWAMGIVRPVCEQFPYATIFFIPFVLISAFIIMNIFIAVIINAMNEAREQFIKKMEENKLRTAPEEDLDRIYLKLSQIGQDIEQISKTLQRLRAIQKSQPR